MKCFLIKNFFSDKSGLGYTGESSSSANVSREMKFVKAKEPMVVTPSVENVKVEKKPNGTTQKVLTKPKNLFVAKPKAKGSLSQSLKEVLKFNIFATIVEFEDTPNLIAINFMH